MTATAADRYQALLSSRAKRGARPNQSPHGPRFGFASGKPDPGSFPYAELAEAMSDVMETDGANSLTYGQLYGFDGLRELIAHKYEIFEGLKLSKDNIIIANGSGDAIGQVIQTFVDDGDPVICEAPTFSATIQSFRRVAADLIGIEMDDQGLRTDLVEQKLKELRAAGRQCKLIYTIDNFQNPGGPTLSEPRRRHLIALAKEYNVPICEDDAYGELRFEGEFVPSLLSMDDSGLVCRTGTLSKILGAGFRLGWVAASPELLQYFAGFNFGGGVSPLTSRIATTYLSKHIEPHVADLVNIYREKRDAMLDELQKGIGDTDAEWSKPEGGFFIWVKLPTGCDTKKLTELAAASSIGFNMGTAFMPNGGGERHIRLAYSFESPSELREGTRLLCQAIRGAMG
ncbi:MAG: PLP-dependent aminotransferase family protein [Chloroflexota bacterium]